LFRILIEVPLHITGIWDIVWKNDEYTSGSIGAGLVIDPPAFITIEEYCRDVTIINGSLIKLRHQEQTKRLLNVNESIRVTCTSAGTLGKGYGLSAALSIAYAVGYTYVKYGRLDTDLSFKLAHLIEVKNLTGLGDVIAEVTGGDIEIRTKPGAPNIGTVEKIILKERVPILVVELERSLTTSIMLREYFYRIKLASREVKALLEHRDLDTFLEVSNRFSRQVGFLTNDIESLLNKIDKFVRGYFVKKQLLVVVPEKSSIEDVYEYLKNTFGVCKIFYTRTCGVKVLEIKKKNVELS